MLVCIRIWIVYLCFHNGATALRKYYMEDLCDTTINMADDGIPSGRLAVTRRYKYDSRMQCHVTILAPKHKRLIIVFRDIGIEFEAHCDDDYLQLFDGDTMSAPLVEAVTVLPFYNGPYNNACHCCPNNRDPDKHMKKRLCGHQLPAGSFTTTGGALTVFFQSDVYKQDNGFDLVFTAFHKEAECLEGEMQCANRRCIDASLKCNGFDNCGDDSDECQFDTEVLIALILSVFLLTVIGVGVITIYRNKKRNSILRKHGWYPSIIHKHKATNCEHGSPVRPVKTWKPPPREHVEVWTTDTGTTCQQLALQDLGNACTCGTNENFKRASI